MSPFHLIRMTKARFKSKTCQQFFVDTFLLHIPLAANLPRPCGGSEKTQLWKKNNIIRSPGNLEDFMANCAFAQLKVRLAAVVVVVLVIAVVVFVVCSSSSF